MASDRKNLKMRFFCDFVLDIAGFHKLNIISINLHFE